MKSIHSLVCVPKYVSIPDIFLRIEEGVDDFVTDNLSAQIHMCLNMLPITREICINYVRSKNSKFNEFK